MNTAELQATNGKRRSGPYKRLQTPPWSQESVDRFKQFDLRATRDLSSRRLGRESARGFLRVIALLVGDTAVALGAYSATLSLLGIQNAETLYLAPRLVVSVLLAQAAAGTYRGGRAHGEYSLVLVGVVLATAVRVFVDSLYNATGLSFQAHLLTGVILAAGLCIWRFFLSRSIRYAYSRGVGLKRMLIVAERDRAFDVLERFQSADEPRVRQMGHISPVPNDPTALGTIADLAPLIEELDISYVLVASELPRGTFEQVVHTCFMHGAAVSVVPATLTAVPCRITSRDLLGWPLLELEAPRAHLFQVATKRAMDIVLSSIMLVALAPFLGLIACAIRLESRGPIVFRQARPGLGGKRFAMLKFRTMRPDAEQLLHNDPVLFKRYIENDCKLPPSEDPRITRIGTFLRRTSLDELPQLWNVLCGDMSLIGPRPVVGPELDQYGDLVRTVLGVRPGMTGYWQVAGRSNIVFPERAHMDVYYVTRWSLGLDLKILFLTLPAVLRRQGAH